jgi:CPA1 family monovalent cation:H+ antiporter
MLSLLDFSAVLLTLSALFGWLNHKFLPLPHSIGLLVMSVVTSGTLVLIDVIYPDRHLFDSLTSVMLQIDFSSVVMNGMLAFLLFAGALHVNLERLRSRAVPVVILAGLGTLLSTAIVGGGIW